MNVTRVAISGFVLLTSIACGSQKKPKEPPRTKPGLTVEEGGGEVLTELAARAILGTHFRRAGFRILRDEAISLGSKTVWLDGFDPEHNVGYEYISAGDEKLAVEEVTTEARKRGLEVLVLQAQTKASAELAIEKFLGIVSGQVFPPP